MRLAATRPANPWARFAGAGLVGAALIWVLFIAEGTTFGPAIEDPKAFLITILNGLTAAALYFVVASGFTLVFGLMRVVNMAHGSLYLLGGYLAFEMQESWFQKESEGLNLSLSASGGTEYDLLGWLVPLVLASLFIGLLGVVIQQLFLRWNQGQDLRQALITIAIGVILADQMLAHFGGIAKDIKTPASWPETVTLPGDITYGFFRLVIVTGSALLIGLLLWVMIKRTRFGLIVRAGVDDRQ